MPCTLSVHVQPRASRNEIVGWRDGALAVRLTAPPVDGAANKACRDFLASVLQLKRSDIELASGEKSREKRFRIESLDEEELAERVRVLLDGAGVAR
jgi:uncharacterized protein (TIGR00251 family)